MFIAELNIFHHMNKYMFAYGICICVDRSTSVATCQAAVLLTNIIYIHIIRDWHQGAVYKTCQTCLVIAGRLKRTVAD